MMNGIFSGSYSSIEHAAGKLEGKKISGNGMEKSGAVSFEKVLEDKKNINDLQNSISSIKFSKHAGERLEERDIKLSAEQITRLENGTIKAGQKGIKDSLVLMDNMAFIVNTGSKTVITAICQDNTSENIYTNIDGTVII